MTAQTLPARLLELAATSPKRVAFRHKQLGRWEETTFAGYAERVRHIALGLAALGVGPGDRVAVHSTNRPEWILTDLAVQGLGAITVGVYPTSPEAEVAHVLGDAGAVVVVAEDEEQVDKTLNVRSKLPELRHIVVVRPRGVDLTDPMVRTFGELEELGREQRDDFAERVAAVDPAACAVLVYTSGTTGPPKGAMLSHRNLAAVGDAAATAYGERSDDEVLSYLPLSHIAERLLSVILALRSGYVVNFGEGMDMLAHEMVEVQPTIFLGVPRIWEKVLAGVEVRIAHTTRFKRAWHRFWTGRGRSGRVAWLVHNRSLRAKLGLARVRVALSGAAPIAPQVVEWFAAIGVHIREAYGQTENTAMATYTPADDIRIGSVGRAYPNVELRIADDGEILTRSDGVFLGYWNDDAATRQVVDADGWLHTGDVGELDADGYLRITDRKKDIIVTAGGKNVSPSEIENRVKVSPYIREVLVVGDNRPYLTALVGIERDTVADWANRSGITFTTFEDLTTKPEVRALVQDAVTAANADFADSETIKQFRVLPRELDQDEGELTPTQKVKRAAVASEFAALVGEMYEGTGP